MPGQLRPEPGEPAVVIGPPVPGGTTGGHAFALAGYTQRGFVVQNSWGDSWGTNGFAILPYDDWVENGMDAWVVMMGVPVRRPAPRYLATGALDRDGLRRPDLVGLPAQLPKGNRRTGSRGRGVSLQEKEGLKRWLPEDRQPRQTSTRTGTASGSR